MKDSHEISLEVGLQVASISSEEHLAFASDSDLEVAWDLGLFYLKTPDELDLESARQFGKGLIATDSPYRQVPQYGELEGFIALENNQQTKLALRRHRWDEHYPEEIAQFGRQLDDVGRAVMREVFRLSGIPEHVWSQASGGYSSGKGTAFLNFVHYDTSQPDLGLRRHTDYGFVTILDATSPGLQIELDSQFRDVPVLDGHLVINFGEALHFITQHSNRSVAAIVHRVTSQAASNPVRHGIVYFANPDLDGALKQFNAEGLEVSSISVEDLFSRLEGNLTEHQ